MFVSDLEANISTAMFSGTKNKENWLWTEGLEALV